VEISRLIFDTSASSSLCLLLRLPVYLILFALLAFVLQRQFLLDRYLRLRPYCKFFHIPPLHLLFRDLSCHSSLVLGCLRTLYTPSHCGKYSSLTFYRVCWHVSWTALYARLSLSFVFLRCCCVRLSSIAQNSPLLPLFLSPTRVSV